jgi:DNA-binding GntR family transcriptional regulator
MSLDTQTKLAIYRHFAETGQRPSLQVVAERVRADVSSVREAYVRLRAQRVLVLEPEEYPSGWLRHFPAYPPNMS